MSTSGESNGPSFGRRLLDALPSLASLAALLVAVTYAIMRYSYVQFYDRFGITPDDVGTSAAGSVAGSAVGLLVFILAYAALPLVLALVIFLAMYDPVTCRLRIPGPLTRLPAIVAFGLAAGVGGACLAGYQRWTGSHAQFGRDSFQGIFLVAALLIALQQAWIHRAGRTDLPSEPRPTSTLVQIGRSIGQSWGIILGMAVIGSGLELNGSLPSDAAKAADCVVRRDAPVRAIRTHRHLPWLGHLGVLSIRADPATLEWVVNAPKAMPERRRVIYLGEANGTTFVFDVARNHALRVPTADVLILIPRHRKACS